MTRIVKKEHCVERNTQNSDIINHVNLNTKYYDYQYKKM